MVGTSRRGTLTSFQVFQRTHGSRVTFRHLPNCEDAYTSRGGRTAKVRRYALLVLTKCGSLAPIQHRICQGDMPSRRVPASNRSLSSPPRRGCSHSRPFFLRQLIGYARDQAGLLVFMSGYPGQRVGRKPKLPKADPVARGTGQSTSACTLSRRL